jgi:cytochrome c-type biogenesis protein
MYSRSKRTIALSFTFLAISCLIFFLNCISGLSQETISNFGAVDLDGNNISLKDLRGKALLLQITNIENPLCRECELSLNAQTRELQRLKEKDPTAQIITLNLRKNSYSEDGRTLVGLWWNINVSWPWIEDFEPYPLTSRVINYTTLNGGFANPTLILTDKDGNIADLYHVYLLGKGEIDGVQKAETLYQDLIKINQSGSSSFKSVMLQPSVTYLGMFILGIITSLSPCSLALLLAMFSYVMTAYRRDEYLQKNTSASKEGFIIGVAFTWGMALVFFLVGLFLSDLGAFMRQALYFDMAAGLLMIVLGINILKPLSEIIEPISSRISFQNNNPDDPPSDRKGLLERTIGFSMNLFKYSAFIGAFSLGVFFSLGWAPCAFSLVFPVLIWLTSQNVTPLAGGMMLFTFGLGHGILVIPIATFTRAVGVEIGQKYIDAGKWITKFFGIAVIIIGLVYLVRFFGMKLW